MSHISSEYPYSHMPRKPNILPRSRAARIKRIEQPQCLTSICPTDGTTFLYGSIPYHIITSYFRARPREPYSFTAARRTSFPFAQPLRFWQCDKWALVLSLRPRLGESGGCSLGTCSVEILSLAEQKSTAR